MKVTHQNVSFIKSGLRIVAGTALLLGSLLVAGLFLILAEVLGIIDEVVEQ